MRFILNYGRAYSPMPAWGAPGGGPLTEQQLDRPHRLPLSIQLPAEESKAAVQKELDETCKADEAGNCTRSRAPSTRPSVRPSSTSATTTKFAGGAYSCGRCHTKGWSYGQAQVAGGGALGPNMTGGTEVRQFSTAAIQEAFVAAYPKAGTAYGSSGLSSGRMGGFGVNPNAIDPKTATMIGGAGHAHPGADRRRRRLRAEPVNPMLATVNLFAGLAFNPGIRGSSSSPSASPC